MADDRLRDLVASSAGRPAGDVPMNRILGLAHRRRLQRRLTFAAVPLAIALLAGVAMIAGIPQARVEFAPADEPDADEPVEPDPADGTVPVEPSAPPTATPGDPEPDPEPGSTPTTAPPPEDDPPGPAPPGGIIVTDGQALELRATLSGELAWRVETGGDGEIIALAVRPGSTSDDLHAVFVTSGPDGFDLRWLEVADGSPDLRGDVEGAATVSPDAAPGSQPWPVWSPDGSVLTWVELPADETAAGARLRVAEWDADARVAVDAAAITLDNLPLQVLRAETLVEAFETEIDGELHLFLSSWTLEAWRIGLVRGAGGWELSEPGILLTPVDALESGVPVAVGRDDGPGAAYFLAAAGDGDGGEPVLALVDVQGHQILPLDEEFMTAEAALVWIVGGGHHVLVGDGERAWVTSRPEGLRRPLDGTVRHAGWVD